MATCDAKNVSDKEHPESININWGDSWMWLACLSATLPGIFVWGQISTLNSSKVVLYTNIGQEGTVKGTYFGLQEDEICTALLHGAFR